MVRQSLTPSSHCYNALFHITCGRAVIPANLRDYIHVLSCGESCCVPCCDPQAAEAVFDLGLYGAAETAPFQSVINIIKVGDY